MSQAKPSNPTDGDLEYTHEGHRERLRQRFESSPESVSEQELLELLLTYAIPRRDVTPIAEQLINQFGNLKAITSAPSEELKQVAGIGQYAAILFRVINETMNRSRKISPDQPMLITIEDEDQDSEKIAKDRRLPERTMRVYANDEVANALALLPKAASFQSIEKYREFLIENLPYNSRETRQRRAQYIIDRFYSDRLIKSPISEFMAKAPDNGKRAVIFYHICKAEPIVGKIADDLVYPNLPIGRITREQIREFTVQYLPDASPKSQVTMLRSLLDTYHLLEVGSKSNDLLRFHLRPGTLDGLVYILTSEFPEPGIYSFDMLYDSPAHRWLLWDKDWLRKQLYRLRDLGVLAKVSEIDTARQFSIAMPQKEALEAFFSQVSQTPSILREASEEDYQSNEPGLGGKQA